MTSILYIGSDFKKDLDIGFDFDIQKTSKPSD